MGYLFTKKTSLTSCWWTELAKILSQPQTVIRYCAVSAKHSDCSLWHFICDPTTSADCFRHLLKEYLFLGYNTNPGTHSLPHSASIVDGTDLFEEALLSLAIKFQQLFNNHHLASNTVNHLNSTPAQCHISTHGSTVPPSHTMTQSRFTILTEMRRRHISIFSWNFATNFCQSESEVSLVSQNQIQIGAWANL